MSEQLPGLELFVSSAKGVEGANAFRSAVEACATACERIGGSIDKVQGALDRFGVVTKGATTPVRTLGTEAAKVDEAFDYLGAAAQIAGRKIKDAGDLTDKAAGRMRDAATGTSVLDGRLGKLGATAAGVGRQLTVLLGAAGAISGVAAGVSAFSDYEDKLRILGTIAGASGAQLRRLEEAAMDLSRATRFSPREALTGLTELSRAGLGAQESIQALKPTADLARVGLISLSDSAAVVSKTMNQFQLGADQASRIADVLTKAANLSNASVSTLADSLSKTGPVARQYGISLEDTVAALAKIADNGLAANVAGTGLQRILIQLRTPTDDAKAALERLFQVAGPEAWNRVNPERVGLIGAFRNLAQAGITVQDAVDLVDTEFASVLTVLTSSVGQIEAVGDALRGGIGEAAKQAAAGADTLAAAFADLRNASEQFAVAGSRGGIGGALSAITRTGAEALRILANDKKAMEEAGVASKALATGLQLAAVAGTSFVALKLASTVYGWVDGLRKATAATVLFDAATGTSVVSLGRAGKAFSALTAVIRANPFVAAATALTGLVTALTVFGGESDDTVAKAEEQREAVRKLQEQYVSLLGTFGALSKAPGPFDDAGDQEQRFRAARDKLKELGKELEGLKDQRIPLEKILGASPLAEAGSQLDKIRQLYEQVPRIQQLAAQARQGVLDQLQAESPIGRNFGVGEARFAEQRRRNALAAEAERQVLESFAATFRALGVETDASGAKFVDQARAMDLAKEAGASLDEMMKRLGISLPRIGGAANGESSAVAALIRERERELELSKLVGVEREKALLFAEAEKRTGQSLTDVEKARLAATAQQVVDTQKAIELRRQETAEAEKLAKQQQELPKALAELEAKYTAELRIAQATGLERELIRAEIEAENEAKQIGLGLDAARAAEDAAALERLKERNREIARLAFGDRQQKREERVDRRQGDALRKLEQEEEMLKRSGTERERYRREIEAENEARQAGLEVGSAEFRSFVERKAAVAEFSDALAEGAALGRDFGASWSDALFEFIRGAERSRDVARALGEDLLRLAYRQTVANNLQRLFEAGGAAVVGYFGGGAPTAPRTAGGEGIVMYPAGTAAPNQAGGNRLTGGLLPAMNGAVIDQYSVLQRGGRNYSVAEGGETTPEAIFRLARDSQGNLGVRAADGAGGDTFNMAFPGVRTQADARAVRSTMSQQVRRAKAADRTGRRGMRPRGE